MDRLGYRPHASAAGEEPRTRVARHPLVARELQRRRRGALESSRVPDQEGMLCPRLRTRRAGGRFEEGDCLPRPGVRGLRGV